MSSLLTLHLSWRCFGGHLSRWLLCLSWSGFNRCSLSWRLFSHRVLLLALSCLSVRLHLHLLLLQHLLLVLHLGCVSLGLSLHLHLL